VGAIEVEESAFDVGSAGVGPEGEAVVAAAACERLEDGAADEAEVKLMNEVTVVVMTRVEVFEKIMEEVVLEVIEVVVEVEVFAKLNDCDVVNEVADVVGKVVEVVDIVVEVVDIVVVVVEVGQSPPGTLSVWPTINKSQLTFGFAAFRASNVTPTLSAMVWPLSPAATA